MKWIVFVSLFLFACTNEPKTMGEACDILGKALCGKAISCGLTEDLDGCLQYSRFNCCGRLQGFCAIPPAKEVSLYVNACAKALKDFSCELLGQQEVPPDCNN